MSSGGVAPDEFVRLSKDYAEIEPVAAAAREVRRIRAEIELLAEMLQDPSPEIREMAGEELADLQARLPEAERALALKLLPSDAADQRPAMLEIRAGTGGDEAALVRRRPVPDVPALRREPGLEGRADLGQLGRGGRL